MDPQPPYYVSRVVPRDNDAASMISEAPSYASNATTLPSYTTSISTNPHPPRYTSSPPSPTYGPSSSKSSLSSLSSPRSPTLPSLSQYNAPFPSIPRVHGSNPNSRLYHSVASRRASALTIQEQAGLLNAAMNGEEGIERMKKKLQEEEKERLQRTIEDPHLVGQEVADRNREERLRRENGWAVLEEEDKRWDWLLAQMSDWEERDKSWKKFRKELEGGKRARLARRLGMGN
ncbi:hypothetical protein B7494_g8541 [Chlorociboria aeruginascens]|nr:hypothetical protein B7494_g8541 [Chlorociboria aeruginascens]